jgi:uncharacterized protein (TIGR02266 family)
LDQTNKTTAGFAEKRAHPRAAITIEIEFKEEIDFIKAYLLNISGGGIFIKIDEALLLDTIVHLRFKLPRDSRLIEAEGKIVWCNPKGGRGYFPKGIGIKFTKLDSDDAERIKVFVDKHYAEIANHSFL